MSNTNTAPKAPSKMTVARAAYTALREALPAAGEGEATPTVARKDFIAAVTAEDFNGGNPLTKAGAGTYFQQIRNNIENGKGLYEGHKSVKAQKAAEAAAPISTDGEDAAE